MTSTVILSDNGASSGSAGLKSTGGNDGVLILQTTTSGGTATNAVYVDNLQNVGIGVTPSTWSLGKAIEVGFSGTGLFSTATTQSILTANAYYNGAFKYATANPASYYQQYQGGHYFYGAVTGSAGASVPFAQVLYVSKGNTLALEGGSASSGTGIAFPATQLVSADANTLDDYEEGSWTPVLRGSGTAGGATYNGQIGSYTKVGRVVTLTFDMILTSSITGAIGNLQLSGFPFPATTIASGYLAQGGGFVAYYAGLTSSIAAPIIYIDGGASFGNFVYGGSGSITYPGVAIVQNGSRIAGVIQYETN